MVVTLNDSGQVYYNEAFAFNDQNNIVDLGFIWGSFNGSTNAPIPFPTGTSIEEIEDQVLSAGPEEVQIGLYEPEPSVGLHYTLMHYNQCNHEWNRVDRNDEWPDNEKKHYNGICGIGFWPSGFCVPFTRILTPAPSPIRPWLMRPFL